MTAQATSHIMTSLRLKPQEHTVSCLRVRVICRYQVINKTVSHYKISVPFVGVRFSVCLFGGVCHYNMDDGVMLARTPSVIMKPIAYSS